MNGFYVIARAKSPASDILLCWTGAGWSDDWNDGALFRSPAAAEAFAKARRWAYRKQDEWHSNPMAVWVAPVTPEIGKFEINFI